MSEANSGVYDLKAEYVHRTHSYLDIVNRYVLYFDVDRDVLTDSKVENNERMKIIGQTLCTVLFMKNYRRIDDSDVDTLQQYANTPVMAEAMSKTEVIAHYVPRFMTLEEDTLCSSLMNCTWYQFNKRVKLSLYRKYREQVFHYAQRPNPSVDWIYPYDVSENSA